MNPNNAGPSQPPSFKTNVNRMKTQRWVEAKSYSYDGDDWGDADDYGEYGGYDEPAPAPAASKPTGFRQAGQSAGSGGGRPVQSQPRLGRSNSFDRGDEQRAFSGAGQPSAAPAVAPMRTAYGQPASQPGGERVPPPTSNPGLPIQQHAPPFYQQPGQSGSRPMFEPNRGQPHGDYRGPPSSGRPRQTSDQHRAQSMNSNTSSDFQNHRDFSPSQVPQPLHNTRPPRKSSIVQQDAPSQESYMASVSTAQAPRMRSESGSQPPGDGKAPAFVRPADIYRRLQEEKEKERLSQESSRPSMDTIGGRPSNRDESPSQYDRHRSPGLDTVAERKSEYGMEGLLSPITKGRISPPNRDKNGGSPVLPEISGFGAGFGDDFGASFLDSTGKRQSGIRPTEDTTQKSDMSSKLTGTSLGDKSLQAQSSLGLTSAVHHAFDQPTVPETASSESGSNFGRSNSESTSAISPIISRGPSSANTDQKAKEAEAREMKIPAIAEEPRMRLGSVDTLGASKMTDTDILESPATFVQAGHRGTSTPSPNNSPARTPVLGTNRTPRYPQEIEVADSSPTANTIASTNPASKAPRGTRIADVTSQSRPGSSGSANMSGHGSPSKGRVRELAEKLNSGSNSRRVSQENLQSAQTNEPGRPSSDRLESFRPNLPGGWNSYTTNATPGANAELPPAKSGATDETRHSSDPFSAAAAAGTALAGALAAAVGMEGGNKDQESALAKPVSAKPRENMDYHPEGQVQQTLIPVKGDSATSIMPTPLGMADGHELTKEGNYFDDVKPLGTIPRGNTSKDLPPVTAPQRVPTMSTESSPTDQESDRLRKQLVRELSPQMEEFPTGSDPKRQHAPGERSLISSPGGIGDTGRHESTFSPSDYESYWNDHDDEHLGGPQINHQTKASTSTITGLTPVMGRDAAPALAPTQSNDLPPQQPGGSALGVAQPDLKHRFSWEGLEELNANADSSAPLPEVPQVHSQTDPSQGSTISDEGQGLPIKTGHAELQDSKPPPVVDDPHTSQVLHDGQASPTTSFIREAFATEPAFSPEQAFTSEPAFNQESLDLPSPSASTHPPQLDGKVPLPAQAEPELRTPAFKEIMALKSESERIQMFNTTQAKSSDHDDLLKNGGSFGNNTRAPIRAPTGATSAQQQQYLSAPTSGGTPASSTSNSPLAGKISSKEVQAKGKDLLKLGGKVGGKANVVAKGFFAKGKKKFGGGEKTSKAMPSSSLATPPGPKARRFFGNGTSPAPSDASPAPFHASPSASNPSPAVVLSSPVETAPRPTAARPLTPTNDADKILPETPSRSPRGPHQYSVFPRPGTAGSRNHRSYSQTSGVSLSSLQATTVATRNPSSHSPSSGIPLTSQRPGTAGSRSQMSSFESANNKSKKSIDVAAAQSMDTKHVTDLRNSDETADDYNRTSMHELLKQIEPMSPLGEFSKSTTPSTPVADNSPTTGRVAHRMVQQDAPFREQMKSNDPTPTQAMFPPSATKDLPLSVDSGPSVETRQQEVLTPQPLKTSKRDSLALGDVGTKRQSQITSSPSSIVHPLPSPGVHSPRRGPSLSATAASQANADARDSRPKLSARRSSQRPFSFIRFGDVEADDLRLNAPVTPHQERFEGNYLQQQQEDSVSDSETNTGDILRDKDLEAKSPTGTASSRHGHRRSFSRPFNEPNIQTHPAYKHGEDSLQGTHTESPSTHGPKQLSSSAQSHAVPQHPSSSSGYPNTATGADRSFPTRSSSRPELVSQPSVSTTHSSQTGKKAKRASIFSSLSGQSDYSRRLSKTSDLSRQTDVQPQSPLHNPQHQGIDQHRGNASVDQGHSHERTKSSNILQRLTSETTQPKTDKADKGKKKRFSTLGGLFGRGSHNKTAVNKTPESTISQGPPASTHQQISQEEHSRPSPNAQNSHQFSSRNQSYQSQQRQKPYDRVAKQAASNSQQGDQYQPTPQPGSQRQSPPQLGSDETPQQHQRTVSSTQPHQSPGGLPPATSLQSSDFLPAEPLDGYYSPDRQTTLPEGVPLNPNHQAYHPPPPSQHHRISSAPLLSTPQPYAPPSEGPRRQSSSWDREPSSSAQHGFHSRDPVPKPQVDLPPPPPPPKDPIYSTTTSTRLVSTGRRHVTQTSTSSTVSQASRAAGTQSVTSARDPHSRAHSAAHDRAMKQSAPLLQSISNASRSGGTSRPARGLRVRAESETKPTAEEVRARRRREIEQASIQGAEVQTEGGRKSQDVEEKIFVEQGEGSGHGGRAGRRGGDGGSAELGTGKAEEEDRVVMSSTSYPGQEWRPDMEWDGQ